MTQTRLRNDLLRNWLIVQRNPRDASDTVMQLIYRLILCYLYTIAVRLDIGNTATGEYVAAGDAVICKSVIRQWLLGRTLADDSTKVVKGRLLTSNGKKQNASTKPRKIRSDRRVS